jgi:hypothetical protein
LRGSGAGQHECDENSPRNSWENQQRGFALTPRGGNRHGYFQNTLLSRTRKRPAAVRARMKIKEIQLAEDKLYKAEYLGSGTFNISKPKRTKAKRRQTNLKNPQRGARK